MSSRPAGSGGSKGCRNLMQRLALRIADLVIHGCMYVDVQKELKASTPSAVGFLSEIPVVGDDAITVTPEMVQGVGQVNISHTNQPPVCKSKSCSPDCSDLRESYLHMANRGFAQRPEDLQTMIFISDQHANGMT